jgi:hypothetical protein
VLVSDVAPSEGGGRTVSVDVVAGPVPSPGPAAPAAPGAALDSDGSGELESGAAVGPDVEPAGASELTGAESGAAGSRTRRLSVVTPAADEETDVAVPGAVVAVVVWVGSRISVGPVAEGAIVALGSLTVWSGATRRPLCGAVSFAVEATEPIDRSSRGVSVAAEPLAAEAIAAACGLGAWSGVAGGVGAGGGAGAAAGSGAGAGAGAAAGV